MAQILGAQTFNDHKEANNTYGRRIDLLLGAQEPRFHHQNGKDVMLQRETSAVTAMQYIQ